MATTTPRVLPGLGLTGAWPLNYKGWDAGMNANLLRLSALTQLVLSQSPFITLPASPADGFIAVDTVTKEVCVRDAGIWVRMGPVQGWIATVPGSSTVYRFDGVDWISMFENLPLTGTPTTPNIKIGNIPSSDANTLDFYEEGAFTPAPRGGTTPGTGTIVTAHGRYTKIGNTVNFNMAIQWSGHDGTGPIEVTGLPFLTYPTTYQLVPLGPVTLPLSAGNTAFVGQVQSNSNLLRVLQYGNSASVVSVGMVAAGGFRASGTYIAAA